MSKLAIPVPLILQFRSRWGLFVILVAATLGLFRPQTASSAIMDSLQYNGHTYYLISENSWTGAAAEAGSLGGYLATINSQAEQDFLWGAWKNSLGTGEGLWIGLHDPNSVYLHGPGNFVWMDGEPVTFTDWAPTEPSDGSGKYKEDFVNLESRFGYNGRWNDLPNAGADWRNERGIVEVSNVQTPEVSTLVLVGSGVAALVLRRRRRTAPRVIQSAMGDGVVGVS